MHYYYGPMVDGGGWGYEGLIGAGIFVLFVALLFLIFMRFMRYHRHGDWSQKHHDGWPPQHRDPLDIARDRYAKGEIDKEQFEQLMKDLKP